MVTIEKEKEKSTIIYTNCQTNNISSTNSKLNSPPHRANWRNIPLCSEIFTHLHIEQIEEIFHCVVKYRQQRKERKRYQIHLHHKVNSLWWNINRKEKKQNSYSSNYYYLPVKQRMKDTSNNTTVAAIHQLILTRIKSSNTW